VGQEAGWRRARVGGGATGPGSERGGRRRRRGAFGGGGARRRVGPSGGVRGERDAARGRARGAGVRGRRGGTGARAARGLARDASRAPSRMSIARASAADVGTRVAGPVTPTRWPLRRRISSDAPTCVPSLVIMPVATPRTNRDGGVEDAAGERERARAPVREEAGRASESRARRDARAATTPESATDR